ncbi:ABC transporter permease [Aquimarina aggregata]|uniref:ABC transporter permease n=1 Tax=Aquimarina aggregata TaxID=1642818 RepID=UPI002493B8B1|nr:ABC transporter permease [Aquimarina aggregata]
MIRKALIPVFMLMVTFPIALLLLLSFGKSWVYPNIFPDQFTLQHWNDIYQINSELLMVTLKSIGISLGVSSVVTLLSFFSSKHISYSVYKSRWLFLAYIPYVFSPVILAATLQFYFTFVDVSGTFFGVILAQLFITYPFGVLIFSNFWNPRIKAIAELSNTLGGNSWITFYKVVLPLSKGVLLLCFFQVFLISWFEYGLTTLIGVGKIKTLTLSVFQYIQEANIFLAALASCLLIIPPMILLYLNKRFIFTNQQTI